MKALKFLILTIFTTLFTFTIFTSLSTKVEAYVSERNFNRNFEVRDDYLRVSETKDLTIISPGWFIPINSTETFSIINLDTTDTNSSNKLKRSLDTLKVSDSLGNNLNYELKTLESGTINVEVKTAIEVRFQQHYSITVEYESEMLYLKTGNIIDIYIPGFSKNYVFESDSNKEVVTTKLYINKKYGEINFVSLNSKEILEGDNTVIEYSQNDLVGETGWIQIGLKQYYEFNINQKYFKTSDLPFLFNTYKIVIPRNINSGKVTQKVYYTEISPSPYFIEEDIDGNLIAYFRVPSNLDGEIKVSGYSTSEFNKDLDITKSGNFESLNELDKSFVDRNTSNSKYWESTNIEMQNVANTIRGDENDIYTIVLNTYKYVVEKIDYSEVKRFGSNERNGALATLRGGAAVCMEYSDLFIALLRSMGIPARAGFGYGYSALDKQSLLDGTINHQWAEVYFPEINSWIPVDTTWGENGNEVIGGDLNHFYSHVSSVSPEIPSSLEVNYLGNLDNELTRDLIVLPKDSSIEIETAQTQEDILSSFKKPTNLTEEIERLNFTLSIIWNNLDNSYKLIIIVIPISLIVITLLLIFRKKIFRQKFSTFDRNIAKIYR